VRSSRSHGKAERDRVGFGIPRRPAEGDSIDVRFDRILQEEKIRTRKALDTWMTENKQENESAIQHLYNIMKVDCSNHWYSFEHRESAQSSVRGIIIRRLGKKLQ